MYFIHSLQQYAGMQHFYTKYQKLRILCILTSFLLQIFLLDYKYRFCRWFFVYQQTASLSRPLLLGSSHTYLPPNLCPRCSCRLKRVLWFTNTGGKGTKRKSRGQISVRHTCTQTTSSSVGIPHAACISCFTNGYAAWISMYRFLCLKKILLIFPRYNLIQVVSRIISSHIYIESGAKVGLQFVWKTI